jgi:hypothetical protein
MAAIVLQGLVTETGELQFDLPTGLPPGEVLIIIETEQGADDELFDGLTFQAKTGAEIANSDLVGAWAHMGIEDSVSYLEEVRRREREARGW